MARSFRAIVHAALKTPGRSSGIGRHQITICRCIRRCVHALTRLVPGKSSTPHDRCVRCEGESLTEVVRYEHECGTCRAAFGECGGECRAAHFVETGVRLV